MNRLKSNTTLMLALALGACNDPPANPATEMDGGAGGTGDPASSPSGTGGEGPSPTTPPRIDTHDPCVLSADCPAGQHCDLGECVQACNADSACPEGEVCSPRARCLAADAPDLDPPPVTERVGTVGADPVATLLTDRDDELRILLTSDSEEPVRYRVQVAAPHLSIVEARGEFVGDTLLSLPIATAGLDGTELPGSVKIFTNLGDLVVDAPIRIGLSGIYQGAMTYDGGDVPLGTVGLVLRVEERNGDVAVEIDGARSLVFPDGPDGPTRGEGTFTYSEGLEVSLAAVVPREFGGERNHFRRPLGRELRFQLEPGASGALQGTFTEKVHGIVKNPLAVSGHIYLERRPAEAAPRIRPSLTPDMPAAPTAALDIAHVFPAWTEADCPSIKDVPTLVEHAYLLDTAAYGPLHQLLEGRLSGTSATMEEIATLCEPELTMGRLAFTLGPKCAMPARLACAARDVATSVATGGSQLRAFSALLTHLLTPGLVVAQNHVVNGVKRSFEEGLAAQRRGLEAARQAVVPAATWALSPELLDYLSSLPTTDLPPVEETGEASHVRALRTLSRLTYLLSTIDGETSRIDAADRVAPPGDRAREAQERGVLTLFEAAAIVGVLDAWGELAPPDLGTEFIDVLSPMDRGFATLLQGALAFGVPEGFIPFLHKAGRAETNFEQVLGSIEPRLTQLDADESAFATANREYEQNAEQLEQQLLNVQTSIEAQIADLCGPAFDFEAAQTDADWGACGADHVGEVGSLILGIEQANERLRSAHGRITGQKEKIEIERRRIHEVNQVRKATIAFIGNTGERLQELVVAEGIINAAQKCMEIASNANLWNLGAPVGMGLAAAIIEGQRTIINVERQRLQTAQEMRIQSDNAAAEVTNGMALVKTMLVDMAQLNLEMQQDVLGVAQAEVGVRNALDRAKRLAVDRTRTLASIQNGSATDPTFRILQDRAALQTIHSRAEAQRGLFLAGRALEYELNAPFGDSLGAAVFNAYNSAEVARLRTCLQTIASDAAIQSGESQSYSTEVSVRRILGITGARFDEVTGQELTAGEQFRQALLRNENIDGFGAVSMEFSSNLEPGNELWPVNVCDDKVTTVEAQLVGDFQGDDEAQVELSLDGGGVLARCDRSELINWSTSGRAVIQAGVNTFGSAPTPNASLRGLSVASARWSLTIPSARTAPANSDLDLTKLEDVVLRVRHQARPGNEGTSVSHACLANVGAGR